MTRRRLQYHTVRPCRDHVAGHTGCPAIALKRWLQRRGFYAGQYQGVVTTDAPAEVVAVKTEERVY